MTSSCILGFVRVQKGENRNFFVFHLICLKFGLEGNFEMLITKRKPNLDLENDLSKKVATIALPWQQCMSHGTGLYSK